MPSTSVQDFPLPHICHHISTHQKNRSLPYQKRNMSKNNGALPWSKASSTPSLGDAAPQLRRRAQHVRPCRHKPRVSVSGGHHVPNDFAEEKHEPSNRTSNSSLIRGDPFQHFDTSLESLDQWTCLAHHGAPLLLFFVRALRKVPCVGSSKGPGSSS